MSVLSLFKKKIPQCDHNVCTCDCACAKCDPGADCAPTCDEGSSSTATTHTCSDGQVITCYSDCTPDAVSPTSCNSCNFQDPVTNDLYSTATFSQNTDTGWTGEAGNWTRFVLTIDGSVTASYDSGSSTCNFTVDSTYDSSDNSIGVSKTYQSSAASPPSSLSDPSVTLDNTVKVFYFLLAGPGDVDLGGSPLQCGYYIKAAYSGGDIGWGGVNYTTEIIPTLSEGPALKCASGYSFFSPSFCCPTHFSLSSYYDGVRGVEDYICVWTG